MFRIPPVMAPGILPLAELSAARLDGDLFAVDECWVCADEPDGSEIRAEALSRLLPPSSDRLIVMGISAAWLHAATDVPPPRHEACSRLGERSTPMLTRRFVLRELLLADADVERIGPVRVTTPVRTAFDLARRTTLSAPELRALATLVGDHGVCPADATDGIRATLPGARLAIERIAALWNQPPLTR
ncbi:hypothetical protein [Mycetocola manganoxydans]|nr:hypothetical protein [Mycetocola manganoxydans]GHD39791.1 hypothetical protein GCM10008097_03030 [Mycetocola manganoxydans]